MKNIVSVFAVSGILLSACSSTHHMMTPVDSFSETGDEKAVVVLTGGQEITGTITDIGIDSLIHTMPTSGAQIIIPASAIQSITIKDHGTGALEGLGLGAVSGAAVGTVVGIAMIGEPGIRTGKITAAYIPFFSGFFAVPGALIGLPIGLGIGHTDTYVFSTAHPHEFVRMKRDLPPSGADSDPLFVNQPKSFLRMSVCTLSGKNDHYITRMWQGDTIRIMVSMTKNSSAWTNYISGLQHGASGRFAEAESALKMACDSVITDLHTQICHNVTKDVLTRKLNALPAVLLFRGINCSHLWLFSEMLERFNAAINKDPQYAAGYIYRGNAWSTLGKPDSALSDFSKALALAPDLADVYTCRGVTHFDLGRYEDALSDFDRTIRKNPETMWAYYNKAHCCEKLGRTDEAIQAFKLAIKNSPPEYEHYIAYAEAKIEEMQKR